MFDLYSTSMELKRDGAVSGYDKDTETAVTKRNLFGLGCPEMRFAVGRR